VEGLPGPGDPGDPDSGIRRLRSPFQAPEGAGNPSPGPLGGWFYINPSRRGPVPVRVRFRDPSGLLAQPPPQEEGIEGWSPRS